MEIKINNLPYTYNFYIQYYYKAFNEIHFKSFNDLVSFEEFMMENHPDINLNDMSSKYAKRLETLQADASAGIYNNCPEVYLYCFIGGDTLYSSLSYVGIQEKMSEFYKSQDRVNDGYLYTFLANNWNFEPLSTNSDGYKIRYWYDKNRDDEAYKIRAFKDKVLFEQSDGQVHSMIISDNYYIYYAGKNKNS